jgi:hypothetical protein
MAPLGNTVEADGMCASKHASQPASLCIVRTTHKQTCS